MKEKYSLHFSAYLILILSMISFALTMAISSVPFKNMGTVLMSFFSTVPNETSNIHRLILILVIPVIISPFVNFRLNLSRRMEFIISALLIIPIAAVYSVNMDKLLFYPVVHLIGIWFTLIAILILYKVKSRVDSLSIYFLSVFIFILSGLSTTTYHYEDFVLLHLMLLVIYFRSLFSSYYRREGAANLGRSGWISLSVLIAFCMVVFMAFNAFVFWLEPAMNFFIVPGPSMLNYGGQANETSLNVTGNSKLSNEVVLRIYSSQDVFRLRSKVYTEYIGTKWKTFPDKEKLEPEKGEKWASYFSDMEGKNPYYFKAPYGPEISSETSVTSCRVMVRPGVHTVFFTLPATFLLSPEKPEVQMDQYGIFYPAIMVKGMDYYLAGIRNSETVLCPETEDMSIYLTLPELSPEIKELAENITKDGRNDYMKCLSVENFFHNDFKYSLGFIPKGPKDPVEEFILNRESAHCEFLQAV